MHLPRLKPPILAATLAALLLAGCGGGGPSDEEQITATIERAFTQSDPKLCGELLTPLFIKTFYGTQAKCEQTASQRANASTVAVLKTTVKGDLATSLIKATGGSASPKPTTLRLVKDGGIWKIDGVGG